MKKVILITVLAIFSLSLTSCSKEIKTKTVASKTSGYFIPDSVAQKVSVERNKFRITRNNDNVWNIAQLTLGDKTQWGKILVQSKKIGNESNERFFIFRSKYPGVKIFKGDTLWLPNNAINCQTLPSKKILSFNITGKDLQDFKYEIETTKTIPANTVVNKNNNEDSLFGAWLVPTLQDFLLLLLALTAIGLLIWFLIYLYNSRNTISSHDNGCEGMRNDIHLLSDQMRINHDNQMEAIRSIPQPEHMEVALINAANNGGGANQGYSHLEFENEKGTKISYTHEKNAQAYSRNEMINTTVINIMGNNKKAKEVIIEFQENIIFKDFDQEKIKKFVKKIKKDTTKKE